MNNYQIIFFDVDGTLRNKKKEITKETLTVLKKLYKMNVILVLCTGRSIGHSLELNNQYNLFSYIISSSGAEGYDVKKQKFLWTYPLDKNSLIKIYELAVKHDLTFLMNYDNPNIKNLKYEDESCSFKEFVKNKNISQCIIYGTSIDTMKKLKKELAKISDVEIKNQSNFFTNEKLLSTKNLFFDINNKNISKGQGIKSLCQILNINLDKSISIGDGLNDISMFKITKMSIAMGNADEIIKKHAKKVTKSNEEDGVAIALKDIFKI